MEIRNKEIRNYGTQELNERKLLAEISKTKHNISQHKTALASYAAGEDGISQEDAKLKAERVKYIKLANQLNKARSIKKQKAKKTEFQNRQQIIAKANAERSEAVRNQDHSSKSQIENKKRDYLSKIASKNSYNKAQMIDMMIF